MKMRITKIARYVDFEVTQIGMKTRYFAKRHSIVNNVALMGVNVVIPPAGTEIKLAENLPANPLNDFILGSIVIGVGTVTFVLLGYHIVKLFNDQARHGKTAV